VPSRRARSLTCSARQLIAAAAWVVLGRAILTSCEMARSVRWLAEAENTARASHGTSPPLEILVPALREQQRILPTLRYLAAQCDDHTSITVVTTEREHEHGLVCPSTQAIVVSFIATEASDGAVRCVHLDRADGRLAHQLNHALAEVRDADGWIALYNADSRPHPRTIAGFRAALAAQPDAVVFQQPALFFANDADLPPGRWRWLVRATATLQSRWTLAHEIPRLLRQREASASRLLRCSYAHVVGHGLFVRADVLRAAGGFPIETPTEDLFLGFLLRSLGWRIEPLPLLELADTPRSVLAVLAQRRGWFFGPLYVPAYLRCVWRRPDLTAAQRAGAVLMSAQVMLSAVAWLTSGPLLACTAIALVDRRQRHATRAIAGLGLTLYGPLQHALVVAVRPRLDRASGVEPRPVHVRNVVEAAAAALPASVLHALPPYASLLSVVHAWLHRTPIVLGRTDDA
jgi:cellulose synthase/poly-beta-1,6-N-acetylglucosamine synthase-like glycosyltransferase